MLTQPLTLASAPSSLPAHVHRWVRLPKSIGLFRCPGCRVRAVCPGCLNSLNVALVAADAGYTVIWCREHDMGVSGSPVAQLG